MEVQSGVSKILMVASEATPFASTGGLAEVLQGLPVALRRAGHQVAVLLPFYPQVRALKTTPTHRTFPVTVGPHTFRAEIHQTEVSGVHYFFLDIPKLYERPGLYGSGYSDYPDNHLRFAALARGALAVCQSFFTPRIIHCHDWHTGLLPVLLRESVGANPSLDGIKTVFTIHNLAFQGRFPRKAAADLGLNGHPTHSCAFYPDGTLGFLRGALVASDAITTVSPTYARDIQTTPGGCGLEDLLLSRRANLYGIVNGIDFEVWNPAADPYLPAHFSFQDLSGKDTCKRALLKEFGLPASRADKPLIGVVARLTPQKGFNLLMHQPEKFLKQDATLVLLGSGDAEEEDFFRWLASAYPAQVSVRIGYAARTAHQILAGADLFLMPSRYEPCGLTQLYAMRYGTLPLVHNTGGLNDTVSPETGFRFARHAPEDLLACLKGALAEWQTPAWHRKQMVAMQFDSSWRRPATEYAALYEKILR
jgi:starch synthase